MPDNWIEGNLGLRLHRARSWIERARLVADDADATFIFSWIAFNAAYVEKHKVFTEASTERDRFREYFRKILDLDSNHAIQNAVWEEFPGSISFLLENQYVYAPFWFHWNGMKGFSDWESRFNSERSRANNAFLFKEIRETEAILAMLFDRLYVLRNQLLHGGATWNGSVNRRQVEDGARIMAFLVPLFLDLMEANPKVDWGSPPYPVVN